MQSGLPGMRSVERLARLLAALVVVAAASGLLAPSLYLDNPLVSAAWRGTDLITLLVAVPLLARSARGSRRGSRAWRLALLGTLLYTLYDYSFYLFGAAFNAFFLLYVAIVTLSACALLLGLAALDVESAASVLDGGVPVRVVAAFMAAIGILLGGFWTVLWVVFLLTGNPPPMVAASGHPTNLTGALDLTIVVPLALLAAFWLRRRRPWGYVLAVMWNVQGAVYMLALSSATVVAYRVGAVNDVFQLGLWLPIGIGCVLSAAALLRGQKTAADP